MDKESYLKFENKFRGSRDKIKKRLYNYYGLLEYILDNFDSPKLLDLGCGRGEWLEICNDKGISSLGIESNDSMYEFCKGLKLNVVKEDALIELKRYNQSSFQIISAFHLIEHLDNNKLEVLMRECQRLLEPGGVLILETPSIDNIKVSTKNFYLDPTHINHINPDSFVHRLNVIGFEKVKYYLINGGPLYNPKSFSLLEVIGSVAQDVVFIGTINNEYNSHLFAHESFWKDKLNIAISTDQAYSLFDEKIFNIEQSIKLMNKQYDNEINNLKNTINFLLFRQNKIFNSLPFKLIRKIKANIKFILLNIRNFVVYFIHFSFRMITSVLSDSHTIVFYKFISKISKLLGQDVLARKILSKIIQIDKINHNSHTLNDMLSGYYESSSEAKKTYQDFK
ncbi:class I SAM-dependent methyltransferase [Prochlorococcus sp. MIT 0801]|uniref:class I SAM-dependent methyltransferase n=1 Tax=Prochlorococcus sp. MIT 0801 TaxID=1501269 RepID=UPI0004F82596|nr:class I SAM-dependent methyltransferase [Prochlorococcus sp. MIT 0801]AIQ98280.1 Methyltransferase type 11 [Prochlorococcus sp. MIT 0801]